MRFPPTSAVGQRHMNKEPGVGKFFSCQRLEGYVPVAWLNTFQRDGILSCGGKEHISGMGILYIFIDFPGTDR